MEDKAINNIFPETMKTMFWLFQNFWKMLDLFTEIVKENGEENIGYIFSYVYWLNWKWKWETWDVTGFKIVIWPHICIAICYLYSLQYYGLNYMNVASQC